MKNLALATLLTLGMASAAKAQVCDEQQPYTPINLCEFPECSDDNIECEEAGAPAEMSEEICFRVENILYEIV